LSGWYDWFGVFFRRSLTQKHILSWRIIQGNPLRWFSI
jgi:hypothetical protein